MSGATCPHHARAHPPATVAQVEHELGTPDAHTAQAWTASPPPLASSLLSPLTCRSARPPPCSPSTLPLPPASSVTASSAACFSPVYASRPAAPGSGVVSFVRARRALGFAASRSNVNACRCSTREAVRPKGSRATRQAPQRTQGVPPRVVPPVTAPTHLGPPTSSAVASASERPCLHSWCTGPAP